MDLPWVYTTGMTALNYIDSHCHIDFTQIGKLDDVIADAQAVGVNHFINPSVNHQNWSRVLKLSQDYDEISPALGIHPWFIEANNRLERLSQYATEHSEHIVAIGEIGLDGAIKTSLSQQLDILVPQLQLASELELPVICHAHKAYDPLLKQLRRVQLKSGGVIHAFNGSSVQANEFIKLGFKLGIGGLVTYPSANKLRAIVKNISLQDILLETDAPDMPLHRQQRRANTPANIPLIAKVVSECTEIDLREIASQTSASCIDLFDL